jgi:dipeptidyl-peptidase 4
MRYSLLLFLSFVSLIAFAQRKISVDDFTLRPTFSQKSVSGIKWMKDGKFYSSLKDNKIIKYNVTTGEMVETLLDGNALSPIISIEDYSFSADEKQILLSTSFEQLYRWSFKADYYVYNLAAKSLKKLSGGGKQSYATFSPDGARIAFVRDNNLFVVSLLDMKETAITTDGAFNEIINGSTDWVYEEEFGFTTAFFWSPDSKKIAYYRFDERHVKQYNMQKWNQGALYPQDYTFKYPKAGEANSFIEIFVYDLTSQQALKADLGTEKDIYIPRVSWTKDANTLSIRKMNRLQNQLEILHMNATTGTLTTALREKSETYIDINDDLTYLDDKKHFIHTSESGGYQHIYLYTMDGKLVRQITQGEWEVTDFVGVDEKLKTVFYVSTEVSPLQRHLYSIGLDGKKKVRLTMEEGTHTINMSTDYQFYIDYFNSADQPNTVRLFATKGNKLIKVLETNESLKKTAEEFGLATKEFFTFQTIDGSLLNGMFLKPKDFDASKKYPVLLYQYSGPGSQNVSHSWGGSHFYFHQMLTQSGYIVAIVDTRGTGFRGEKFKKITYKQLGKYELEDHIATARYLSTLSFVDGSRIGIWGWSYGGYMSSLAMTNGGGVFKMGIAVAPVTNWRYYDTIYTERYLQRPQDNASGYDDNSPSTHAAKLTGKFLLIHGTGDDNVHFQNSVVLQEALVNAGKQFDSFYYPDKHHGIQGGKTRQHLYTLMLNYVKENL